MDWQIVYYSDKSGNEPVRDFIDRQSLKAQTEIFHVFSVLRLQALSLGLPYVKKIGKSGIRELRIRHSSDSFRIFYFAFTGRKFVLLHAFLKKTAKTPERELKTALKRMADYRQRYA